MPPDSTQRPSIDADALSERYRAAAIRLESQELLITNFIDTDQEPDLAEPPNCNGYGRIRHFTRHNAGWIDNPLPIEPARHSLSLPATDVLRAQVFQNAICNWRCWYCFVPFDLLSANTRHSGWLTPATLVDCYAQHDDRPEMIDLSGGQPDLTPEWIPWMLTELTRRGLADSTYVWSDDNLSNDYFWRYLSTADRDVMRSYPHYGRVACFKGFDEVSFAFNTAASPTLFDQQFELFERLLTVGVDTYAYVTFTTPPVDELDTRVRRFVDRLQAIHHNLPLRTVPLEIAVFTPVKSRLRPDRSDALVRQRDVLNAWSDELGRRFTSEERRQSIAKVSLS